MKTILTILLMLPIMAQAQSTIKDTSFNGLLQLSGRELAKAGTTRNLGMALSLVGGMAMVITAAKPVNTTTGSKNDNGGYYLAGAMMFVSLVLNISANSHENKAGMYLQWASGRIPLPSKRGKTK